ncbi:HAMP domain-containing histidine kinase [Desertifilum sp. FACHB-1129]|uniref:histidine kinase n=1 Tax=Desertifilum tharense IPPAS B-1220 TaxID=1781255 RepID=A0A1E5QJW6_9CYAN|nr:MULTISPECIES: HAMP domain-containing sensor histidine kinase [Desertifilum]MDA0210950.1 HAMP domain-containing sensor histidine kinase [Cyanobacteria bacterium FC1]MBD2313447.1 HAMP domain-containing histidine kinase [Desertifilum sp. FACHB-1129]MBD2322317.1 HAMP domain-containing histidine kinase [Desertifilum sp. FACHB-866]MBD2332479.1 HAMP domain-containing histidine kinase [Desertifilum sp. FACHB-868]OEJ74884.1 histidine kinase [Desertifilum tharense IPPAS B-1220]
MNLRQKLLTTFGGLALLALTTAGMTVWAIAQWQSSNAQLEAHYERSLLLQRIQASVFRAFKEVPDAVSGGDLDAAEEFDAFLGPIETDFERWAALADTAEEEQQVEEVRLAYQQLVASAQRVFALVDAGQRREAFVLLEGELEDEDFESFQTLTEQAIASDRDYRSSVHRQVQRTLDTTRIVLAIAAFGTTSLILLLFAYLASDLFSPLREVKQALEDVTTGDFQRQLDEERADEIGDIHRAFNQMMAALQLREQMAGLGAIPAHSEPVWQERPSRVTLHRLVSQLRSRVTQLNSEVNGNGATAVIPKQELIQQLDRLLQAVTRVTEFGFPLDLNLARTDIRTLIYEVLLRFHDELAQRAISLELDIGLEVKFATVDRLKLREAIGELVRNALAALPEMGGRVGVRANLSTEGTELLIEVADNGRGAELPLVPLESEDHPGVGLQLTRAIVEQHGGHLVIDSQPGVGTYVQMQLPLRD